MGGRERGRYMTVKNEGNIKNDYDEQENKE